MVVEMVPLKGGIGGSPSPNWQYFFPNMLPIPPFRGTISTTIEMEVAGDQVDVSFPLRNYKPNLGSTPPPLTDENRHHQDDMKQNF